MINSSAYTRANVNLDPVDQNELTQSFPIKASNSLIEKSIFTYMVQAYLHQLMMKTNKSTQEKNLCCRELGRSMGKRIAEKLSDGHVEKFSLSSDKTVKYQHEVKFLCEIVWPELFGKKVDKLQFAEVTSTFTFQDNSFRLIKHISHPVYETEQQFISLNFELTCGIIEGVASRFGHETQVKYQDKAQSEFQLRFKTPGETRYFSTY